MLNKKAQIGETITWVVAFLVIFLIMLLFTAACIAISATKGFTSVNKDYLAQPVSGDIQTTENLISLLNSKMDKLLLSEQLVQLSQLKNSEQKDNLKSSITSFIEKILDKQNESIPCYDFYAYTPDNDQGLISVTNIKTEYISTLYSSVKVYKPADKYPRTIIYLRAEPSNILIKFYQGKCN